MDATNFILIVGYITTFVVVFHILQFIWKMLRCYLWTTLGYVKDLRRYGEWAVVTGATDGIGKEYAQQLAKQGFNIVLISRTKLKLQTVSQEIREEFKVQTKIIEFDFSTCSSYACIEEEIKDLEVGLLINNVGTSYGTAVPFYVCDVNKTTDILHTNIFSTVRMTNIVLQGMVNRGHGAIVYISSGTVYIDIPLMNVYASTKVFLHKFVKSLQLEYRGVIDHQILIPGYVSTKMSKREPGFGIPTPKEYVRSAINTIGIAETTHGYFLHELLGVALQLIPNFIVAHVFMKVRLARFKNK